MNSLYKDDFEAWCDHQITLLTYKKWKELDVHNLIDAINFYFRGKQYVLEYAVESYLLYRLLTTYTTPETRKRIGRKFIIRQNRAARAISDILDKHSLIRGKLPEDFMTIAYLETLHEIQVLQDTFNDIEMERIPPTCPYTLDQCLILANAPGTL